MGAVVVIGAGPGIGRAVARRFAATGRPVGVAARSRTTVDGVLADLDTPKAGVLADVADEAGLRGALGDLVDRLGVPEVVVYNAGVIRTDRVTDLDARTVADTYAVNVGGAVTAAAFLLPRMADLGGGSFLATAGMPTPLPTLTTLSLGKAALRALVELLATEWAPREIGCSTVTVCGPVAPGTDYDPDVIAEEYFRLHETPVTQRPLDVRFGDPADAAG
ncbi:SDR family oxidoreductase [Rhodococcoides kroppenstedtii]|uniref:SDR family oxidoreductase n=1 Tax=Rhodococcoides kroppenstedtii TaxID=293050 RepID=UPI001427E939|nr:SDR family oxidoreductase [Rhodococcus kroppenstedtii]NIL80053.1 putative oxidoreductase EphD [Rhodococcus kroppenstedtii]